MSDKSKIEWTDATWGPVTGCSKVSQGCKNCYAEREWPRLSAPRKKPNIYTGREFIDVQCHPKRLDQPLRWKKPRRIFVNSMSDLFHEDVPIDFIDAVWSTMAEAKQHIFQVLTKRPKRMRDYICKRNRRGWKADWSNIWLGVSVENQETADERIPLLLQTPAAVRWLSIEPLLGPVNLAKDWPIVEWVVVGGESGPKARPMHPAWVRSLHDQCQIVGVPFFFKQWGEWAPRPSDVEHDAIPWADIRYGGCHKAEFTESCLCNECEDNLYRVGKRNAGRTLDGKTYDEYPIVTNTNPQQREVQHGNQ